MYKQCDVKIRLSDYTKQVPYQKCLQDVKKRLDQSSVDWSMGIYETWLALRFPKHKEAVAKRPEEVKVHMLACSQGCHMVSDGKLYYCGALCSTERCGLWKMRTGDVVDLTVSEETAGADKLRVLRYCLGAGADNPHEVVAGVQSKKLFVP